MRDEWDRRLVDADAESFVADFPALVSEALDEFPAAMDEAALTLKGKSKGGDEDLALVETDEVDAAIAGLGSVMLRQRGEQEAKVQRSDFINVPWRQRQCLHVVCQDVSYHMGKT